MENGKKEFDWELLPYNSDEDVPEYCLWKSELKSPWHQNEIGKEVIRISNTSDCNESIDFRHQQDIDELIQRLEQARKFLPSKKQSIKIIGVAGQKQQGKDTLADHLAPQLTKHRTLDEVESVSHLSWGRGSFAIEVKRIYCTTFNKDMDFIERWKENPEPPPGMNMSVRQSLQFIGDGFRKIQENIWIELAFRTDWEYKVFSDVRYCNEARKIRQNGGINFLMYRPGKMNFDENPSESEIRPYVQWCEATGKEGFIQDWPEFQGATRDNADFFDKLSLFDYFVRNEENVERLLYKVDHVIVPAIKDRYELQHACF